MINSEILQRYSGDEPTGCAIAFIVGHEDLQVVIVVDAGPVIGVGLKAFLSRTIPQQNRRNRLIMVIGINGIPEITFHYDGLAWHVFEEIFHHKFKHFNRAVEGLGGFIVTIFDQGTRGDKHKR